MLKIFRKALMYWLLAVALVMVVAWPIYRQYCRGLEQAVLAREHGHLEMTDRLVQAELQEIGNNTRVLAGLPRVRDYLLLGQADIRGIVEEQFVHFAQTYQRYDQVRLLDMTGQERVRVNFRGGRVRIVPGAELQNKADRYYFKEALRLDAGEIYLSPLDLNIEHGQVERPLLPMIRVAALVRDASGRPLGVLVVNYQAEKMLKGFRELVIHAGESVGMLVNAQGQFLSHPDRDKEWGWMLGHPEHQLSRLYPRVASTITAQDSGQVRDVDGVYLFSTIKASVASASAWLQASPDSHGPQWKLVVFVPERVWQMDSFLHQTSGQVAVALMLLALGVAAWAQAVQQAQRAALRAHRDAYTQELQDLYDNAPCGYHSLDADGRVVRMNRTELSWLGYQANEVVGQMHYADLVLPETRALFLERFQDFMRGVELADLQIMLRRRDGSALPVSLNASAVRNEAGEVVSSRTTVTDITERHRLELELQSQARTDPMTGVSNRRDFYDHGARELARAQRSGKPVSVLMLDIDHFKKVNDSHGHHAGDLVLKGVAEACVKHLRSHDLFARMGGEEFAALLPETDLNAAREVANRMREALAAMRVTHGDERLSVTVSVGVASQTDSQDDLDRLLVRADEHLYQAKSAGRNRVVA
ncbi:MAG TPA: diguanylate cyclase [Aquabacterium sp.]|uniref:sensor domain-containing diguanylate cyclase n=1 Tax=Aquabacterium sp. TaxID=1872578 RepID=UPI002E348705|nr:diguanylate cyclase [Aquabacterium sp.]HEX5372892.1 diguanylate cyclase [Aquabacterium sp.]